MHEIMSDDDIHNLKVLIARLEERLRSFDERLKSIDGRLKSVVTQDEFKPIRMIIYGAIGAVLMGVIGALLHLVIRAAQ